MAETFEFVDEPENETFEFVDSVPAETKKPKKPYEADAQMWSAHGEGARRADLERQLQEETKSGKQLGRKALRYGGAGVGGALAGIAAAPTGIPTVGATVVPAVMAGVGGGYGIGDVFGNLVMGEDPARQLQEMGPLMTPGQTESNVVASLAKGLKENSLKSAENVVKLPYEVGRSVLMPVAQGNPQGALEGAKNAAVGLVDFPYTATGTKDLVEKYVTNEQPRDGRLRNAQMLLEESPFEAALGLKMAYHAPGQAKALAKGATKAGVRAFTDLDQAHELYRSAMKPTTKAGKQQEVSNAIDRGLEKGAIINRKGTGLEQTIERVEQREDAVSGILDESTGRISVGRLDKSMEPLRRAAFDDLINRDAIQAATTEFIEQMRQHPQYDRITDTLPVKASNQIKRQLYKNLRKGGAYDQGQQLAGKGTAAKGTARALMTAIEDAAPEIAGLNKELGKDLNLQKYLERATSRIQNTDVMGIRTRMAMIMGATAPKFAVVSLASALFDNPGFKSRLAIAIYKANKGRVTPTEARRIVREMPDRIAQQAREEEARFNPEVLPPPTGDLGPVIGRDIRNATSIEEGGVPPAAMTKPRVENPEALPPRGAYEDDFAVSPQANTDTNLLYMTKKLRDLGYTEEQIKQFVPSAMKVGGVAALASLPFLNDDDRNKVLGAGGLMLGAGIPKPFYSAARNAVESVKFPPSIKGQSLINELKRNGVTEAEMKDLGLAELTKKERVTKDELLQHIDDRGMKFGQSQYGGLQRKLSEVVGREVVAKFLVDEEFITQDHAKEFVNGELEDTINARYNDLFDKKFGVPNKNPQYATYKAIKSEEGVLPSSYAEDFVTLEGVKIHLTEEQIANNRDIGANSSTKTNAVWRDEHSSYSETKNPLVRVRYDMQQLPDGRKVMRIHEIQDPKPVRQSRDGSGPVPQSMAERSMDVGIKYAIAKAKELGADGISWATGEQQRDLYGNALRNVADEARYNPETKTLSVYKNGSKVKDYADTPPERIGDYIGSENAKKLMENEYQDADVKSSFSSADEAYDALNTLRRRYDYTVMQNSDFSTYSVYDKNDQKVKFGSGNKINRLTDMKFDAQWPSKLYGDYGDAGFNHKALVPSLLKKYGKGEFGDQKTTGNRALQEWDEQFVPESEPTIVRSWGNESLPDVEILQRNIDNDVFFQVVENGEISSSLFTADTFAEAKRYISDHLAPKEVVSETQPTMFFTDKTPSSFPMYDVTAITQMLKDQVKKEGGGKAGVAKVALKVGVPAAVVSAYVLSKQDSERRKLLKKYPALSGITPKPEGL